MMLEMNGGLISCTDKHCRTSLFPRVQHTDRRRYSPLSLTVMSDPTPAGDEDGPQCVAFPMTKASSRTFRRFRYVEVTAVTVRDTRGLSKHGLSKALWKSKERVKGAFAEAKVRVIIKHANESEEVLEQERNRGERNVVIDCAWCVVSLPR